jgi:hypothetical protein
LENNAHSKFDWNGVRILGLETESDKTFLAEPSSACGLLYYAHCDHRGAIAVAGGQIEDIFQSAEKLVKARLLYAVTLRFWHQGRQARIAHARAGNSIAP